MRAAVLAQRVSPTSLLAEVGGDPTASVEFVVLADGRVEPPTLRASSGLPDLDAAALDQVRRVQRVPSFPPDMSGERIRLVLPVAFHPGSIENRRVTAFVDNASGLRVVVEPPLAVIGDDPPLSEGGARDLGAVFLRVADPAAENEFCDITLHPRPPDAPASQANLDEPLHVAGLDAFIELGLASIGRTVQDSSVTDYRGARLVEATRAPKPGIGIPDGRLWSASLTLPEGELVFACIASAADWSAAYPRFRTILDATTLLPRG